MKLTSARRNDAAMAALAVLVVIVDQLTKYWVVRYFGVPGLRAPIPILGQVLELYYIRNTGVAFSLLEGQSLKFVLIAIAIVVIGALYWRMRETAGIALKATFGLILGGAVGNLIDRFTHTYVVDFIHFQIPHVFDWPVFNIADSAICVGVVVLAYLLWRGAAEPEGDGATRSASLAGRATTRPDGLTPVREPQAPGQ